MALPAVLLASPALAVAAEPAAAGRWEGVAEIPGAPQRLVVDLAERPPGQWLGSVILPGRGVKGAALEALSVDATAVRFAMGAAFRGLQESPPRADLQWLPDGSLAGRFLSAGLEAPLALHRTGPAQPDLPSVSTSITPALAGTWTGRYELGNVPRQVTLTLANRNGGGVDASLLIVGKRTTRLAVDQVQQGRSYVSLTASSADFRIEGRLDAEHGTIEGAMSQGPFEAAIRLERQPADGERPS